MLARPGGLAFAARQVVPYKRGFIMSVLFDFAFYPFTSGTWYVVVPVAACFVCTLFSLVLRLIRRRF